MPNFIDNFANQVINSKLATWWTMQGCWSYEIRDLENHYKVKLPTIYKDFLEKMGKGAGKFMQGTDMFYRSLFSNQEAIEDVLELECHPFSLEKDIFVLSSHQGYIFHFFNIKDIFFTFSTPLKKI
jgi:hypothetical protein